MGSIKTADARVTLAPERRFQEIAEMMAAASVAQLAKCLRLDLPDSLARDGEILPSLLERVLSSVLETKPHLDDFSSRGLIGAHWFDSADAPTTGLGGGENHNLGFIHVTARPYQQLVDAAKETHQHIFAVHSGSERPVEQPAASL